MDDATRLALIRAVLATFKARTEIPGFTLPPVLRAIDDIADETGAAPGYAAMRDGWLTAQDAAAILTADSHHPANLGSSNGR
jgi:hypothetical protein